MSQVVAVDIGGTHVRFARAHFSGRNVTALDEPVTLRTAEYASFQTAWQAFSATLGAPHPRAVAVAIASPVSGDVLQMTNNPWIIRPALIPEKLDVDHYVVVNDFEAVGHAVAQVGPEYLRTICGPDVALPRHGLTSIVGPGTGLGVGQVFRTHDDYHVIACEGGHADFAPLDSIEDAILAHLRKRFRRVSVERIVSGPGLSAIYGVLARLEGREVLAREDKELWTAALDGSDSLAAAALDRFCLSLGAVAGDIALGHGPTAVVIAGGIGLRIADHLPQSGFAQRFAAKGRFESLMRGVPVKLITHPQPGLLGAAAAFARSYPS